MEGMAERLAALARREAELAAAAKAADARAAALARREQAVAKREAAGNWSLDPVAKTDSQQVLAYSPVTGEPGIAYYDRPTRKEANKQGLTPGLGDTDTLQSVHFEDLVIRAY